MELEHSVTPYKKINSKWIKDLKVKPDAIKLLEENIGWTLPDINRRNMFFDPPSRVMKVKTKINRWCVIKPKSFCTAKETIDKIKRICRIEENICKWNNHQRINLQNMQTAHATLYQKNKPIEKWTEDLNWHFSKEDRQMAKNTWKDVQHHLLLQKCKSKLHRGTASHWSEWPSSKESTNNKC